MQPVEQNAHQQPTAQQQANQHYNSQEYRNQFASYNTHANQVYDTQDNSNEVYSYKTQTPDYTNYVEFNKVQESQGLQKLQKPSIRYEKLNGKQSPDSHGQDNQVCSIKWQF